jgi:hypothetical protein
MHPAPTVFHRGTAASQAGPAPGATTGSIIGKL